MRNSIWYNASNYYDPTCGAALSHIIAEERRKKQAQKKEKENNS